MTTFNPDDEVKLYTTNAERERSENLGTLYSIVVCLALLERAYVRDSIPSDKYTPACTRLLAQYKTVMKLVSDPFDLDAFVLEYRLNFPAAIHRLKIGLPATVEHSANEGVETALWIAEATQNFITFMDALKLNLRAKDQLHLLMSELVSSYTRFPKSNEWAERPKLVKWAITLNKMKVSEEITEEQSRELLLDIESAYQEFFNSLK